MSSEEENSSNSDESSFPSEADDLASFNSESSDEESDLLACSLTNLNQSTRAMKNEVNGEEQQHEQDDRMGNLDW